MLELDYEKCLKRLVKNKQLFLFNDACMKFRTNLLYSFGLICGICFYI